MKKNLSILIFLAVLTAAFECAALEFVPSDGSMPKCLLVVTFPDEADGFDSGVLKIRPLLDDVKKRAPDYGFKDLVTEDDPALKKYMTANRITLKKLHGQDRYGKDAFSMLKPFMRDNNIRIWMEITITAGPNGVQCYVNMYSVSGKWGKIEGFVEHEPPDEMTIEDTVDHLLELASGVLQTPEAKKEWLVPEGSPVATEVQDVVLIPHPAGKPFPKSVLFVFNGSSQLTNERSLPVSKEDEKTALDALFKSFSEEKIIDVIKCGDPEWDETARSFGYDDPAELEKQDMLELGKLDNKRRVSFAGFARKAGCGLYFRVCLFRTAQQPNTVRFELEASGIYPARGTSPTGFGQIFPVGGKFERKLGGRHSYAATLRKMGPAIWDKKMFAKTESGFANRSKSPWDAPVPPLREKQNRSVLPEQGKAEKLLPVTTEKMPSPPPSGELVEAAVGDDGKLYIAAISPKDLLELYSIDNSGVLKRIPLKEDVKLARGSRPNPREFKLDVRNGLALIVFSDIQTDGGAGVIDLRSGTFTRIGFLPGRPSGCALMNGKVYLLFISREANSWSDERHIVMECDTSGNSRKIVMDNARIEKKGYLDRRRDGKMFAIASDPARNRLLVFMYFGVYAFYPDSGKVEGIADFHNELRTVTKSADSIQFTAGDGAFSAWQYRFSEGKADIVLFLTPGDPESSTRVDPLSLAAENIVRDDFAESRYRGIGAFVMTGEYFFASAVKGTAFDMRNASKPFAVPQIKNYMPYMRILPAGDGKSLYLTGLDCGTTKITFGTEDVK